MTVLVVGASGANGAWVAQAIEAAGLRAALGRASRPQWVLVATAQQRREALGQYGLPAYRVVQVPGLDGDAVLAGSDREAVVLGVRRMREIGPHRPAVPGWGLRLTTALMPWIGSWLERTLGTEVVDADAARTKKARLVAVRAEARAQASGPEGSVSEEKARLKAQAKADRKAVRRAQKPSVIDPPVRPSTS